MQPAPSGASLHPHARNLAAGRDDLRTPLGFIPVDRCLVEAVTLDLEFRRLDVHELGNGIARAQRADADLLLRRQDAPAERARARR